MEWIVAALVALGVLSGADDKHELFLDPIGFVNGLDGLGAVKHVQILHYGLNPKSQDLLRDSLPYIGWEMKSAIEVTRVAGRNRSKVIQKDVVTRKTFPPGPPNTGEVYALHFDIRGGGLSVVLDRTTYADTGFSGKVFGIIPKERDPSNVQIRPELLARSVAGNLIRFASSAESGPDQQHTYGAEPHPNDGRRAHNVGPKRGLPLCGQVLLLALVCAAFMVCLGNAIRLIDRGQADAGIPYLFVGVSGIFGGVIVGFPLVFGGF